MEVNEALGSSNASWTSGSGTSAVAEVVERLEDGVKHGVDVLLQDTSRVVVNTRDVRLDDIGVRAAEESEATVASLTSQSKS